MSKIILENIAKESDRELPEFYKNLDTETFGIDFKLHDYQQKALYQTLNALFLYYNKPNELFNYYRTNGILEYDAALSVYKDDANYEILSEYYPTIDDKIDFKNFINRASLWMATGSGKTLVMIKIIEQLYYLASNGFIPKNDILLLAPKPEILEQIKEHIEIFNKNGNLKIALKDLREWERIKQGQLNLYDANSVTIFYYRSDNITDVDKTELLSYKTVFNNGKWYVLLDEAHKGDSEDSKRQQYYTILSKNGFLFNFSATFTDTIDIVTTVFNFNLKKFIEAGYGKHIKISGEEFINFNKHNDRDFNDREKYVIVLKSLIMLTAIKKEAEAIHKIHKSLYHNPLLITLANEVNTVKADLKLFFQQIGIIASGDYELDKAKEAILQDLLVQKNFLFETEILPSRFILLVKGITKEDILKYAFNATSPGKIEYTRIIGNSREIAFRMKTAKKGKHFCLLVASDATNWSDNVLANYEYSRTPLTKSFFKEINSNESEINILLGSRIFTEGWDSNRPNVINFINLGVNEDAQKFVLQAIGRGVRIQPFYGIRKRLNYFSVNEKEKIQTVLTVEKEIEIVNNKKNLALESLHIFATNKEVIQKIIENLNKNTVTKDWKNITSVERNINIQEELLIATYNDIEEDIPAYNLSRNEYTELMEFVGDSAKATDKILLMKCPDRAVLNLVDTLSIIRTDGKITTTAPDRSANAFDNLLLLNNHFHQKPKILNSFKKLSNEIIHFESIQVANLNDIDLAHLEELIKDVLSAKYQSEDQLFKLLKADKIGDEEFKKEYAKLSKPNDFSVGDVSLKINKDFLEEHYYKPLLIADFGFEQFIKHVISEESEKEFLKDLLKHKTKLSKYDWWYFSKIDESLDKVSIPYYDTEQQKYRNFFPDFIFWLKKDNKYIIKFIDPKGIRLGWVNAEDKALGYAKIFSKQPYQIKEKEIITTLTYYDNPIGRDETLKTYTTKDFDIIFNE
jgi:superfamily II DNA or RNA helicase